VRVFGKCYDAIAKRLSITTHFANNDWLEKNPAAARAFIGALKQTAEWCNKNHVAAGDILAKITKIDPATIKEMNRVVYSDGLEVATIQPVIDATAEYKFLPKSFKVSEMFWSQAQSK
jgi:ABC-type nitrate/sulfonate/bicarbonate transport system substrate-binding protein